MGSPVSTASVPRTRPSVELMAMQRTTLSPICCATSATISLGRRCSIVNGVEQVRQLAVREADVQHRADDLHDRADVFFGT